MSYDLKPYFSDYYYDENGQLSLEMAEILSADNFLLNGAMADELESIQNNQNIATLNVNGLSAYESMIGIVADLSTESESFRRSRLLNRYSARTPFTMTYLKNRLDAIIGKNKYTANMDYATYTLTIEASAIDQAWSKELQITLNSTIPANISFFNKPLLFEGILVSEEISASQFVFNYRAGTTARASMTTPLESDQSLGILKGGDVMSVQTTFLDLIADELAVIISKALINDTYSITTFTTKSATGNLVNVEYLIPATAGLTNITNIKLLSVANEVLTNSSVYVSGVADVIIKHVINTKEGI